MSTTRQAPTGARFPFACTAGTALELRGIRNEPARGVADEDLVRLRGLLQPFRRVDGVARDERRRSVAGDDFAAVDADPNLEVGVELGVQALECGAHLHCGANPT